MDILILEDEPLAASRLKRLISELEPQSNFLDTLDTIESAVGAFQSYSPDLAFLDIHLADGNVFSLFEKIEVLTPVIFCTAYDQYAIQAFKVNSIDYLLKPVEKVELAKSLAKHKRLRPQHEPVDLAPILAQLQGSKQKYQKRFMVSAGEKIISIPVSDIAYFWGQNKYVFLITHENRKFIVDHTLGNLEALLDPETFIRINRQFIITHSAIENMFSYSKSRVKIELKPSSEMEAIVSVDRSRLFKEWLNT